MLLARIEDLRSGMLLAEDVFSPGHILLLTRGAHMSAADIDMLRNSGVRYVHIKTIRPTIRKPLRVSPVFPIPVREPAIKPALRHEAIESLSSAFELLLVGHEDFHAASVRALRRVDSVVEQLVDTLMSDQKTLVNISDLKSYDEYTYHHSLSVAVLAISIGQHFGYHKARLNDLGKSAMLHDIGKTAIPLEILHKTTRLTDVEFNIIRSHPFEGYVYLTESGITSREILDGVLMHHEKVDGTGYPYGLTGEQIPAFARIISVADVYDALTSARPYRQPNEPSEALEYVMGAVDSFFDYDIVHAFAHKLDLYPEGSFVRLSNGRIAVVINNENQMRPIVRLLDTGEYMDLCFDRRYTSITIKELLPDGAVIIV